MRCVLAVLALATVGFAAEPMPMAKPVLVEKPDAFPTLVNPNCSHCIDEAKRRKDELKPDDPVLCWTRGYSDGGAIPIRFFLNAYRVISDSYGVFVYDPDAGYARGFAASYNFEFHGYRDGVMVMRDKSDGTLFSCLTGVAFQGKRTGERLTPIPTIVSTWGEVMERNPNAVTYHLFEKYKPKEIDGKPNEWSLKSQPAEYFPDRHSDRLVLAVRIGGKSIESWYDPAPSTFATTVKFANVNCVVLRSPSGATGVYEPIASQPRKWKAPNPDKSGVSPPDAGEPLPDGKVLPDVAVKDFADAKGKIVGGDTTWGVDGRGLEGKLKGWTLKPVESVVCKRWILHRAYPDTLDSMPRVDEPKPKREMTKEYLGYLPKMMARIESIDEKNRTVKLLLEGDKYVKTWPIAAEAEIWRHGYWGRLSQFHPKDRVWVWLNIDAEETPTSVAFLGDSLSQQYLNDVRWRVKKISESSGMGFESGSKIYDIKVKRGGIAHRIRRGGVQAMFDTPGPPTGKEVYLDVDNENSDFGSKIYEIKEFDALRADQMHWLRKHWRDDGLPGTVMANDVIGGELEVRLDHEAMRWGRSLKPDDKVTVVGKVQLELKVASVAVDRQCTRLKLSTVREPDAGEFSRGQRVGVKMKWPAKEIDESPYPTDIDRKRTDDERIEWFLASIYCTCPVNENTCTGQFFTLASCNPGGCGAPKTTRAELRELIAKKFTDKQIWDSLLKDRSPLMARPHLLPPAQMLK